MLVRHGLVLIAVLAGPLAPALAEDTEPPQSLDLEIGSALERELVPGEKHRYRLDLAAGHWIHLEVDQRGVDLEATLRDPDSRAVVFSDRPISSEGPEELQWVAERSGAYVLELEAFASKRPAGSYEIRILAYGPADAGHRLRAEAAALFSTGTAFLRERRAEEALAAYRRSLSLWREAGDLFHQGETLTRIGEVRGTLLGEWQAAAAVQGEAAALFHAAGSPRWEAVASSIRGRAFYSLGETEKAIEQFRRALPLCRQAGYRRGEALAAGNLGQAYMRVGESQAALDAYLRALRLWDPERDGGFRADALHNLGVLYRQLGRWPQARQHLEAAERAYGSAGEHRRQTAALNQLGQLLQDRGALVAARDIYRRVLELRRQSLPPLIPPGGQSTDTRGEAVTLGKIGRVLQALGEPTDAAEHYRRALSILNASNSSRQAARVLLYQGSLRVELGRPEEALASLRPALAFFSRSGEKDGAAEARLMIAAAERRLGRLAAARAAAESALEIIEAARPKPTRPDLRVSFFATLQHHYDFYVDLLMEQHRAEPAAGHDAAALEASEMARARSLLDLLEEGPTELRQGAPPELLARERRIQTELNRTERQRKRSLDRLGAANAEVRALEQEVEALIEQLQSVRGEIRRQSPRYAAVTQPQPLGRAEIQRQVLDENSLLVEYKLGEEQSFLWAATTDSLVSFELPGRGEIEEMVTLALERLRRSRRPGARASAQNALCALGRTLLGPLVGRLAGRHLLIVPDGVLSYFPFAALPLPSSTEPCSAAPPLISEHEITYLPSASVLAALRRETAGRPVPAGTLAVLADPVFSASDPRLETTASAAPASPEADELTRTAEDSGLSSFSRLVHSGHEAGVLLGLVADEQSFAALGFAASKEKVAAGHLADFRLVHLATHGILNSKHPDLSGLVFSLVDAEGASRDGFLRAHEIYNLELNADLVVLSACRTALGRDVRGEGMMSLTRAFFYAGASRVMVSLWNVDDLGTAILMERFYRHLLEDALRPAAALRQAQLSMWREKVWAAPYYWAAFVIQGDPR